MYTAFRIKIFWSCGNSHRNLLEKYLFDDFLENKSIYSIFKEIVLLGNQNQYSINGILKKDLEKDDFEKKSKYFRKLSWWLLLLIIRKKVLESRELVIFLTVKSFRRKQKI